MQHALFPRVSVTAGYYRRSFQHIQYTKNTLVDPVADYQPFNIAGPSNPNLPGGGGGTITALQPERRQARHRQQRADLLGQQLARVQRRSRSA